MTLSEKILSLRKKAGLSQEALAEQLGVSRQAISKWELGEAEPELKNIRQLAQIFGVSLDYLLSDEEAQAPSPAPQPTRAESWIDSLPSILGRLLRRFGWLAGVYIAAVGGFWSLSFGLLYGFSKAATSSMDKTQTDFFQQYPGLENDFFGNATLTQNNPAFEFFNTILIVMMLAGLVIVAVGLFLAWKLKKLSREQ